MFTFVHRASACVRLALPLLVLLPATSARAQSPVSPPTPDAAVACAGADALPDAAAPDGARAAMLCLINQERAARGLPALRVNRSLQAAAAPYAQTMVANRFFDHISPNGSTLRKRVAGTRYLHGVRVWTLGENLATGSLNGATPASMVAAWMASPAHRRNILERIFRDIGIGIAAGVPTQPGVEGATYVTDFGRR